MCHRVDDPPPLILYRKLAKLLLPAALNPFLFLLGDSLAASIAVAGGKFVSIARL